MKENSLREKLNTVKRGFDYGMINGVGIYTVPSFSVHGIRYGFTSRTGGVSKGRFASMNLSLRPEDDPSLVRQNFEKLCSAFEVKGADAVVCNYRHGENVEPVGRSHSGMGYYRENTLPGCDGIMTDVKDLPLVTLHADCVPIAIFDPVNKAVCLCHSGWRGVIGKISVNAINKMTAVYGTCPEDCIVSIGPSIMQCCFEVDLPVAQVFMDEYDFDGIIERRSEKYNIDLIKCISAQLFGSGIDPRNLTIASVCTSCNKDSFFSFRRDCSPTGAMAQIMII